MSVQNQFLYPLYTYAVGWFKRQRPNPLDFIAPPLSTGGALVGTYKRYPQKWAFRAVDTTRAPYAAARAIGVEAEDVPFRLEDHSLRIGVDDHELAPGAGRDATAREQLAQAKLGTLLSVWNTSAVTQGFATLGKLAEDAGRTEAVDWSGTDDPIAKLKEVINEFRLQNGALPNRVLIPFEAWNILAENDAVLDLVTYNDAKTLTTDLLLKLLGYSEQDVEAPRILRASVPVGAAEPGPATAFAGENALGASVWLTYVAEGDYIGNLTGMRTLHAGDETPVESVETYYVRENRTTWYEVGLHRAFVMPNPYAVKVLSIS